MVLYFSATGNTKYAAETIAEKLGDRSLDLTDRIKRHDYSEIYSNRPFVICCPVYVSEMPLFFMDYIKKVKLAGNRRVYFVFTCGASAGISGGLAKSIVWKKHMIYMGSRFIVMPNNYIASDLFAGSDDGDILYRLETAKLAAQKIALAVKNRKQLKSRHIFLAEKAVTVPLVKLWVRTQQPSTPFHTSDKCVGCGKCVKVCPLNNITLVNKRPVWESPCAHCMACICSCPTEAIDYGNITQNKLKYHANKFLPKQEKKES
ncbi:Flavodoxin domain-containing protein [Ruminococcus sp. YE71]|uniref:EFR1 family ferrodoxin n=1 Tax=unclassified Ruminococcus TaxID=2608920 RepID=UPI00088C1DA2|nr:MULTISPECIES: EFR1 family ferrodoxin [unclassified Ruminococcus]SDA14109.1 Flavodoxin domain-containing protein [Ruminococcus sp. YE78]SFW20582.1 Flavodoxin domain-containing protein [Ruminococcus sp. YE71]